MKHPMKHAMKDTGTGRYSTFAGSRQKTEDSPSAGAISSAISSAEKRRRVVGSAIGRGVKKESGNGGCAGLGLVRRGCSEQ